MAIREKVSHAHSQRITEELRGTPPHRHPGRYQHQLRKCVVVVLVWLLGAGAPPNLHAQRPSATEYQVKAAYLYNFGKFITWPAKTESTHDSFTICVLGNDPFYATLDSTLASESISGKTAMAKRIMRPQEALSCQILFIGSSEESHIKEILAVLNGASILTVSDMTQFTRHGGMIQFVMEANRVRFEVNLTITQRVGLAVSSQLLKVASNVRRDTKPGN